MSVDDLKMLFHPVLATWFQKNLGSPTEVQEKAWTSIRDGQHILIAAPTGSGKTLAAFYSFLDDLTRQQLAGELAPGNQIVYVSPLKALSNDIERNLQVPLRGISQALASEGLPESSISVMVRTGDTPAAARTAMTKNPPHILVTTPESLYLLLTSAGGRNMLSTTTTVIVDEIHAMADDKRGSHLTLSLERLEEVAGKPLRRIGISATQKPIEKVADFLVGYDRKGQLRPCTIIDTGHQRKSDFAIEMPASPLSAVMAAEVWSEVYGRLEALIKEHQTTLIFVNTRRLAERLAHQLT